MKHKHHDLLVTWLADQTLKLEYEHPKLGWSPASDLVNPISDAAFNWRIKPKMVKVGRHKWPMPLDVAPVVGSTYFLVVPQNTDRVFALTFGCDDFDSDMARLRSGMLHTTREAAQQHADALVAINRGDV